MILKATPIEWLDLELLTYNILKKQNINTFGDLQYYSDYDLLLLEGFNKKLLAMLKENIKAFYCSTEKDPENLITFQHNKYYDISYITNRIGSPEQIIDLIHSAFRLNRDEYLYFILDNKITNDNISIDKIPFTTRTSNCLHRNNLHTINDILFANADTIRSFKNLGDKTFDDLIECLIPICVFDKKSNIINDDYQDDGMLQNEIFIIDKLSSFIYDELRIILKDQISFDAIRNKLKQSKIPLIDGLSKEDLFHFNVDALQEIYSDETITALQASMIHMISKKSNGLTLEEIQNRLPKSFVLTSHTSALINNIKESDDIEIYNDRYIYKHISIIEYINNITNEQHKEIILAKLYDTPAVDVLSKYNITNTRVMQIVHKYLSNDKQLCVYENKYAYWFKKYKISKKEFAEIFNTEPYVYNYLRLTKKQGELPLEEIKKDKFVTKNMLTILQKDDHVLVYGEKTKRTIKDIVRIIMKNECYDKPYKLSEIRQKYIDFCKNNNLDNMPNGLKSLYIEDFVLRSINKSLRYHDNTAYNIKTFIETIDFKAYNNSIIYATKIFNDYPELMKDYDILSPCELHNFMRKNINHVPDYVHLTKMPTMIIGKADRESQTKNFLHKNMPITTYDFKKLFTEKYGIPENTFNTQWSIYINEYIVNSVYCDVKGATSEQIQKYINEANAKTKHMHHKSRCVRNVETGEIFESTKAAGRSINRAPSDVSRCCRGKRHTVGGYHWEYVNETIFPKK